MGFRARRVGVVFLAPFLIHLSSASGSVGLILSDKDATPSAVTVSRGGTFPVSVLLNSSSTATANKVTGVDYFLQGSTGGVFTIVSRNTSIGTGTAFPDPYTSDASVANSPLNQGGNLNSTDLGATVADGITPVSGNTFEVADYVISVSPTALAGTYTLSTFSQSGSGYVNSTFVDNSFNSQGTFSVTVTTPEPGSAILIAGMGILALRRRRPIR